MFLREVFLFCFNFVKWYLYFYCWYFLLIVVLSLFTVELGVSRAFVKLISKILEFAENSRKEVIPEIPDDDDVSACIPITSPAVDNKLYTATILQNGKIPVYSSTIKRDIILLPELQEEVDFPLINDNDIQFGDCPINTYELRDAIPYIKAGIEAIVEDQISSKFEAEELKTWNLLTRRNPRLCFYNWKIAALWLFGLPIRYLIIFPVRFLNCFTSILLLITGMAVVGYVPESKFKKIFYKRVNLMCFHVLARWLGMVLTFHSKENRPKSGIAVSNHTTPFDVLALNTDHCYSLTGQRQPGIIGILERALSRASPHIWFERAVSSDRGAVARRLKEHVEDPQNPPILIFPEGTCINNTAVAQFKKGAFEVGATVYPIALKYDARFGDPFWNSSKQSGFQHVIEMMSSWAIVCNIYYLPAMERKVGETSIQFANRVKAVIAERMNVVDLSWDGGVKRSKPKPESKELHRKLFCQKLKARVRNCAQ